MKTNLYNPCRYFIVMLMLFYTGITDIKAQSQFEFAFSYGPSNFLGDLGGNSGKGAGFLKDNMVSLTRFMGGANLLYRPNEFINFRLSLNIGKLEGADSLIAGKGGWEEARKARNQHFRSNVEEAFVGAEIYPTALFEYEPEDDECIDENENTFTKSIEMCDPDLSYSDVLAKYKRASIIHKLVRSEGRKMLHENIKYCRIFAFIKNVPMIY
jgi:hypothetical protein